ncbi:MAG TPA: hypothetical protein VFE70_01950 [Candidatus Elarobacter sp.]|nr:hypothetical protein [Candidatus Elarobacter sp.]
MALAPRLAALGLAVLSSTMAQRAQAEGLRTLQVDALSMRADRTHLRLGDVFHVAIHVHVREHVGALDELVVPNVGTMQLEGDERVVTGLPSGTDVVETLTLEPTQAGAFTFSPAYLDAIDGKTGKPTRFSTNPVRVVVDPAGVAYPSPRAMWGMIGEPAIIVAAVFAVAIGLFAILRSRRRRPRPSAVVVSPPPVPTAGPPPRTPRDEVADALRAYVSAPANGPLIRLRAALFAAAGARPGATLRDALATTGDAALQTALGAAERTAFGPAYLRDTSSVELIDGTQAWLR